MGLNKILLLILLTILPLGELRFSIPVGILSGTVVLPMGIDASGLGVSPFLVFALVVPLNILLGFLIFNFLEAFDEQLKKSTGGKRYNRMLENLS